MLIRYGKNSKGRLVKQAKVYTLEEHGISRKSLDRDAVKVTERLRSSGYQAFIVGGAVRDLLIGKTPKDYDIATDAYPSRVRKIFRNSRVIGKRFRLVHVYFSNNKILEVATFRSLNGKDGENVYGTLDEDAKRRDFTLNALYYSPREEQIIDYHDGVRDIRSGKLRSVISLDSSFKEDPVRMLRAVKYSVMTDARIPMKLARAIKRDAHLLADCSVSRMSEEIFKILQSGFAEAIIRRAEKLSVFEQLLPRFHNALNRKGGEGKDFALRFYRDLEKLDNYVRQEGDEKKRGTMLYYLSRTLLEAEGALKAGKETQYSDLVNTLKELLRPMIAPNRDVMDAIKLIFKENKWKMPRRKSPFAVEGSKSGKSRSSRRRRSSSRKGDKNSSDKKIPASEKKNDGKSREEQAV